MAKKMQFVDSSGTSHQNSYWIPTRITIDRIQQTANIDFHGYSSKQMRDQAKSPIGSKFYLIEGEDFETYFGIAEQDKVGINPIKQAYKIADKILETDGLSFFSSAVNE